MIDYAMLGFLTVAVSCPIPDKIIADDKDLTWTENDDRMVQVAQAGCRRHFGKDSCLISLEKLAERDYRAVCKTIIPPKQ